MQPDRLWNPFANMGSLAGHQPRSSSARAPPCAMPRGTRTSMRPAVSGTATSATDGSSSRDVAAEPDGHARGVPDVRVLHESPGGGAGVTRSPSWPPVERSRVLHPGGGSDAVDTAAKLAVRTGPRSASPKSESRSRANAYHGMNAYGTSLAGIPGAQERVRAAGRARRAGAMGRHRCAERGHRPAGRRAGGCVLRRARDRRGRGVASAGGLSRGGPANLPGARRPVRGRRGRDGFGRVGEWFASQRWNLEPDIVTTAKGLTSGYIPLGAVIVGERVAEPFSGEGHRGVPPRVHVLGAPHGVRGGAGQPGHHRTGGADRTGSSARAGGPASHEAAGRPPARRRRPRGDRAPRGGGGPAGGARGTAEPDARPSCGKSGRGGS